MITKFISDNTKVERFPKIELQLQRVEGTAECLRAPDFVN